MNIMKWKIFFLLLFVSSSIYSQSIRIDSLKNEITKSTDDFQRIALKNNLANELRQINKDTALLLSREALDLSITINDRKGQLSVLQTIASIYKNQKDSTQYYLHQAERLAIELEDDVRLSKILIDYGRSFNGVTEKDSALYYLTASLQISKENRFLEQQFFTFNDIGKIYKYNDDYSEAEIYFLQALEVQEELGTKIHKAGIYQNLGNNAGDANDLDKAVEYYEEAFMLMDTLQNKEGKAMILSLIAYTYMQKGYFPLSLEYYQKSLSLFEKLENNGILIQDLRGIGVVYEAMENYPKALTYYQQVLKIKEEDGDLAGQVDVLNDIGQNHFLKAEYETAIEFYYKALQIQRELRVHEIRLSNTLINIGSVYEKLNQLDSADVYLQSALGTLKINKEFKLYTSGLISLGRVYKKRGVLSLAESSFAEALDISKKSGFRQFQMEASEELYQIFSKKNNYRQALHYYKAYQNLQDSLFNVKNMEKVVRLEVDFEFEKEKQRLAFEREKEQAQQKSFRTILSIALAGAFLIILIIARYTQQKRKANEKLQRLNAEVSLQKEKLEELDVLKSQFFTNISHEFRTPLTIISGMIDQVKTKPDLWLEKGSQMIKQNTLSLLNLVNQILDLRKLESGALKLDLVQGDIIQYLRYITESYQSYADNNGLKLHFLAARPKLIMDYDPDKILRVVSNLLSNAVKYTVDGGDIYFHIDTKTENDIGQLQIRIQDTGSGIPESQLKHIFDRFYQVDDSGIYRDTQKSGGTGIGLALTKEFVKLMHGDIEVDSELGVGTTFSIKLPITNNSTVSEAFSPIEAPTIQAADMVISNVPQNIGNLKNEKPLLLIVEDNIDVQQFLIACLKEDYQLLIEDNGQKGIDVAIEQVPALIVSDVMMPVKDGFELCDILKKDERTSHIPIILLTAKADMDSKISGLEKGADAYLTKPFEQRELLIRLKKLLELRIELQAQYRSLNPNDKNHPEDIFIQKVRMAIEKNISDENFGIIQLCRVIALSRAQLHNKIKALTGLSTSFFIRSIRLQKAKQLLETTDLNVSEIAYEVGFKSSAYFSTVYLEEYGVSPSKTRK